jgi:hypothetical protein
MLLRLSAAERRPARPTAEFVDASAGGADTFFFGMLDDVASKTLWTCQLIPVGDTKPVKRHTARRGFDLSTGAQKLRWNLPGDNSTCNDFSVGPDKALYISDTATARSTNYRSVLLLANFSQKIARSVASTGSPFWMARCM